MFRSNFASRQTCFTEIVMTQAIGVITRPQRQFYKTFLASDQTQQVAIEELFRPEHQFGIFGGKKRNDKKRNDKLVHEALRSK